MSPLNVGIIGTGIFATDTHLPTIQANPDLIPYAAYNRTKAKAETFAKKASIESTEIYDSLEAIFEDPKVAIVDALLPVQYNLDVVKLAIKNKKPICFEKPLAANLDQAKEIVKLANGTDLPISVLEQWSYFTSITVLKEKLELIGEIIAFSYQSTGPFNDTSKYLATTWRQKPEHIGGYLSDGGVHQLALLTGVLGDVETVSGLTKQVREQSGADDILFSTLKLKGGNNVFGTFNYGSAFGATDKKLSFVIYGTKGSVNYEFIPDVSNKRKIVTKIGETSSNIKEEVLEFDEINAIEEEFKNFVDAVKKDNKSLIKTTPDVVFHHLAIIDAILKSSAKGGELVKVETA